MLGYGKGVMCVPVTQETADRLHLTPMVPVDQNTAAMQTAFLIPVDHRASGTGVSAENRAITIRALADASSTPGDFVKPGHTNPLLAKPGGVLSRAGRTEAPVNFLHMLALKHV